LERLKSPALKNVVLVQRKFDDPVPPEAKGLDLVTLMFNYHDFGHFGVDRASLNRAVFAALKPGGMYVVADHAGRPGTGISESNTLHRVEETLVRREIEAAGFRLADEGTFLRNPADPRDRETPDPPQPKDEFVLKFVKCKAASQSTTPTARNSHGRPRRSAGKGGRDLQRGFRHVRQSREYFLGEVRPAHGRAACA